MSDDISTVEDFQEFLRIWTTDAHGQRIMRGLTVEETTWYQQYRAKRSDYHFKKTSFPWASVAEMNAERDRWLALHDKHEIARLQAIGAEVELREAKPSIN